jgi:hypothetical protein
MRNPWRSFEELPGLSAVPEVWHNWMGDDFPHFKNVCLDPEPEPVQVLPCPFHSICSHLISRQADGSYISECQQNPIRCPEGTWTLPELTPLQINWRKLGRAICSALGSQNKIALFPLPQTQQIGSWSKDLVPVILSIQYKTDTFRYVIAQLALRLRRPFILLAPTDVHIDANTQELLADAQARFLTLDQALEFTPTGTLRSKLSAQELSKHFSPEGTTTGAQPALPPYMIRKDLGFWTVRFEGQEFQVKHERGMFYIAYLLTNPPEQPIHAIDLMAKIPELYRKQLGLPQISNPHNGKTETLQSHARIQERSLALDDAESMRRILKKEGNSKIS